MPYARIENPLTGNVAGSQHRIVTPDKANATYNAGLQFAVRDDDPDYPALVITNFIFGGGSLASRLGNRVRQQEGLSYSVGSSFSASSFDRRAGLSMMAICNPQNIGRVETAMREELDRLLRDGVTKEELELAKQGYLQAQKVRLASDSAIAGLLSELNHTGRTMAYREQLEKQIEALTTEQILAAARKHFDPKKLVIVTAGDFDAKAAGGGE